MEMQGRSTAVKHRHKLAHAVLLSAVLFGSLLTVTEIVPAAFAAATAPASKSKVAVVFGTDLAAFIENDQVVLKARDEQGNRKTILTGVPLCAGVDTKSGITTIQCFFTGGDQIQLLTQQRDKEKLTLLKLKNGTKIKGVVENCSMKNITIRTPELREVPWDQVLRIASPFYCTVTGQATGAGKFVPLMMVSSTGSVYGNVRDGFGLVSWLKCQEPALDKTVEKANTSLNWQMIDFGRDSVCATVPITFAAEPRTQTGAAYIPDGQAAAQTLSVTGPPSTTIQTKSLTTTSPELRESIEQVNGILEQHLAYSPYSLMLGPVSLKRAIPPMRMQNKKDEKEEEKPPKKEGETSEDKSGEGEKKPRWNINVQWTKTSSDDKKKPGGGKLADDPNPKRQGGKKVIIDGLPVVDEDVIVQRVIEQLQRMRTFPDPVPPKGGEEGDTGDTAEGGKREKKGEKEGGKKGDTGGGKLESPGWRNWFLVRPPEMVSTPADGGFYGYDFFHLTDLGYLMFANEYIKTINNECDTEIPLAEVAQIFANNGAFFPETEDESNDEPKAQQDSKSQTKEPESTVISEPKRVSILPPDIKASATTAISIEEAQRSGLCDIAIRSNNDPNNCEVLVTSKGATFTAQIAEKACFMSSNHADGQNLMEATDPVFTVPAGQTVVVRIETFCISTKSIKPPPATGMKYTAEKYPDQAVFKTLVRIAQTAEKLKKEGGYNDVPVAPEKRARKIAQTAIWMFLGKRSGKKSELVTVTSIKDDLLGSGAVARKKLTQEQLQRVDVFARSIYDAARKTVERAE